MSINALLNCSSVKQKIILNSVRTWFSNNTMFGWVYLICINNLSSEYNDPRTRAAIRMDLDINSILVDCPLFRVEFICKVTDIVLKKTAFICDMHCCIKRDVETRLNASYLFLSEGRSWQVSPASIFSYCSASKWNNIQPLFYVLLTVQLSVFILLFIQLDAQNLFNNKFISCLYMFRALWAHRQEVKILLYSIWCHHTCRWLSGAHVLSQPDDTRCCIIQFWPPDDVHIVLETCRGI